ISTDYKLTLLRYIELGRGLADCFLMQVGEFMRAFILVLFSDKYVIGERIVCVNAETGKDNKFAGKMQGPYAKLLPLTLKDTMFAIPHLSRQFHLLKLSGDKGGTVAVKMGPIVNSGHELKQFSGSFGVNSLVTFGADGHVVLRTSDIPPHYEFKVTVSHRYEAGVIDAVADDTNSAIMHLGSNRTAAVMYRNGMQPELRDEPQADPPDPSFFEQSSNTINIIEQNDKNYLDQQEDKKVHEESLDYKKQRDEVVKLFHTLKTQLVTLLEENIREPPLHQLSLSEFNLHLENKKERLKAAEKEREEIRLQAEVLIRAQEKVTLWIKKTCWDTMLTPRVKIYAIFSHYQVENFPVLPTQREIWPELEQTRELRAIEMENNADVFRPWEEVEELVQHTASVPSQPPLESQVSVESIGEAEETVTGQPYALAGTNVHRYVSVPSFHIPQTLSYSFLQMNWLTHISKLNVQNMRLWFNKQFDELMATKRREVGLVEERNTRLRFIIEELNKLSDLRGSFHHLLIQIRDPQWRQEELPQLLTKVEPDECTIPPYISPSQIVIVPPDPGPKDDFRERALNEMMDGVLEKLWHEEIKKPIPMPQCMLEKDPEHFNEEDLRQVFDYESKVQFRCDEREKYRKMLHAEYAKLSQVLNEGIVKFNAKVKELWLTRLRVDSVIGQETLNLMRLRRVNLDRVEESEEIEKIRAHLARYEKEAEELQEELTLIGEQAVECQAAYDALASKDRYMDRTFKNNFTDLSPVIVEQCYKYFKKRPKWHQRASMIPAVLYELASAIATGVRSPLLHYDCIEYFKGVELLDQISNMPAVLDEGLWVSMCRLRRVKIDNEIRMRALALEMGYVESAMSTWTRALSARRNFVANGHQHLQQHREHVRNTAMNRTIQIVVPAGQVEVVTTGHFEDFEDAALILRSDVDAINNLIKKVGDIKLRMMRRQIEFRKGILAKEWEHAQMKMKLRHMRQELYSYERLKIPKELQFYLKNKTEGYTDEMDYMRLEKEMAANKMSIDRVLQESAHRCEEIQVKISELEAESAKLEKLIINLLLKVSEKRLNEDPLGPIRIRRVFKKRLEVLMARSQLIREVQANHTTIVLLQTELELLRLKTYPTLASFQTFC
ncbi:cilia- and flagella-associated protein 43, partial [Hyposmocoma kahamanoa]|uniref:cilia- and flagella-associated protein 43 n=1 Tax=Hyposmocoma kahamanoa TaxID=1477025 RepID=UPI000E6D7302